MMVRQKQAVTLAGFSKEYQYPEKDLSVLTILGSTGSIGQSALAVLEQHPEKFKIHALVAGSNAHLLSQQALQFNPDRVVCADQEKFAELTSVLKSAGYKGQIDCGELAVLECVTEPQVDLVLAAIVGVAGLRPVYAALTANKTLALANKESLVSAGNIIKSVLLRGHGRIIPVDSEHSAIFQALQGEHLSDLKSLTLTASGGPFLNTPKAEFVNIKPVQALKHPNWSMGNKITIDSATMNNKALELIEAYWLYGEDQSKIKVLVHPQSIVHSLIETCDGSQLAQLSVPDMKGAIAYALTYPRARLSGIMRELNLAALQKLEFFEPDTDKFSGLELARACLQKGGSASAIFNLANEVAVEAFLTEKLRFDQIFGFVSAALESDWPSCDSIDSLIDLLVEARLKLQTLL